MNDKVLIIFFILLGISFMNSVLFNDVRMIMNWVYALVPLIIAIAVLLITEMSVRKNVYYG